MNKTIRRLLSATVLASTIFVTPVYAAENDKTHEIIETIDTSEAAETADEIKISDTSTPGDGHEISIIDVADLASSEENNCQLTLSADVPEHFDANIYVQLQNDSTGAIYQYTLYALNDHAQRGYIPDGDYRMIECSVYEDINGAFPFVLAEDFTMKKGDVRALNILLKDPESAINAISERYPENNKLNKNKINIKYRFTSSEHCDTFNDADDQTGINSAAEITEDPDKQSDKTLCITICVIALIFSAGAFCLLYYLKKQMISQEVYTIHEYTPVHNSNKS